jgi:hypothetical protein
MRKSIALFLLVLLAGVAGQVQASAQLSVEPAGSRANASRTSASASVNFRIVVRESLSLGGQQQKDRPHSPPLTQTVSFEDGREVITLARP